MKVFDKRHFEITNLVKLATLAEMKNYSNELEMSTSDVGITDDQIRIRGLELIKNLKDNINKAK